MGDPNEVPVFMFATTSRLASRGLGLCPPQDLADGAQSIAGIPTLWWFLDSVFLDPIYERLTTEIEITGCAGLVPIASVKGPQNELLLDRFQADALARQVYLESIDTSFFLSQELW